MRTAHEMVALSSGSALKGRECLLTLAIWRYGHEAEEYIFLNILFPSNPKEILQFAVF